MELNIKPAVSRITVYPVKALDGISVDNIEITKGGSLKYDREFAMINKKTGKFINGKKDERVNLLRAEFNLNEYNITLYNSEIEKVTFNLIEDTVLLEEFLTDFFKTEIELIRNNISGMPDDTEAYGPTVISHSSLETVAEWFNNLSVENVRRRFRANIEIKNTPPFWEDFLLSEKGGFVSFKIGDVSFEGINACSRCVVPSRDPQTAEPIQGFQKNFSEKRKVTVTSEKPQTQFEHFYKFSVNTKIPLSETGKFISIGDGIIILSETINV